MNNKVILSPPEAKDIKLSSGQSLEENINNLNNAIRELQNLQVGGRNLYLDTKNFSRPSVWANYDLWQKTGETYNGFTVISSKSGLDGTCQEISAKEGEVYTFSAYIKNVDSVAAIYTSNAWDFGSAATSPAFMTIPQSTDFVRHAFTFRVTRSGIIAPMVGRYEVKTNKIEVCGLKLERGNVATDWTPAPEDMKLEPYPVGSIYMSMVSTSPAELFGGTWEQISQGRFLIGAGSNVANTTDYWGNYAANSTNFPAGEMGGEAYHTLTVDEMPRHLHESYSYAQGSSATYPAYRAKLSSSAIAEYGFASDTKNNATRINSVTEILPKGNSVAHNNMPPYLAVYMWKRIA